MIYRLLDWKTLPSLTALRAFEATARSGGFAGAARSLNVTHAAVAQQVRLLERDLGVPLATRMGRTVGLTPEGERLAKAISDGFATIAGAVEDLRTGEAQRSLRVTTTPFLTERIILPRLSEFWSRYPGTAISIHPSRDYVDLALGGFDMAIRAVPADQPATWPGTEAEKIADTSLIALAADKLVAAEGSSAGDLPWLWHDGMGAKLRLMELAGLDVAALRRVPIGSPNLQLEAIRQGLGITLFNENIARHEIRAGGLTEVPLPRRAIVSYFAVRRRGLTNPVADRFAAWVKTLF